MSLVPCPYECGCQFPSESECDMHLKDCPSKDSVYVTAITAFKRGTLHTLSRPELSAYLVAIANHSTGDDAVQSRDTIQAITLNHIILQFHVDELEKRNIRVRRAVICLTIASLLCSLVQIIVTLR